MFDLAPIDPMWDQIHFGVLFFGGMFLYGCWCAARDRNNR